MHRGGVASDFGNGLVRYRTRDARHRSVRAFIWGPNVYLRCVSCSCLVVLHELLSLSPALPCQTLIR